MIEDLTPFFEDRCWMFVLLARQAEVGVILRRGPTDWWRVTLWDTRRDTFQGGQWFHGRMYPCKCDLSPAGKLFIYFAGKFRPGDASRGYHSTWTAVSRPPYLTALALWPIGDTWGGQGVFYDDHTVLVATSAPSFGAKHHPDHPPGPLRVLEYRALEKGDPRLKAQPCWLTGWQEMPELAGWRKQSGDFLLECEKMPTPSRRRSFYSLYSLDGERLAAFQAHWADWDQQGRLVATAGGRVLSGRITASKKLLWNEIVALADEKPIRMPAPDWAQRW